MKAAGMALLLAAAACGGGGSKDAGNADGGGADAGGPPVIVAFTSSDTSLPAGGGTITLSWSVTGATSLSIDQGVGDVTGMASATVDVTATTTYTLTATNALGSVQRSAAVMVAPGMTVTGRIVDADYVTPAANVTVGVAGRPVTTTDATGAFSIPGVSPPYTLVVTTSGGTAASYQGYVGLTRLDPTLVLDVRPPVNVDFSAAISGSVDGGTGFPTPDAGADAYSVSLIFDAAGAPQYGQSFASAASGDFVIPVIAPGGPSSLTGTVYALEWKAPAVGTPVAYAGFGSVSAVTVVDGGIADAGVITLSPVTATSITVSAPAPAGATSSNAMFSLVWPQGSTVLLGVDDAGDALTVLVPELSGATLQLGANAILDGGGSTAAFVGGIALDARSAQLALPAPPTPLSPAAGATLSAPGTFSWQGSAQGISLVMFGDAQQSWKFYTAANTFTLADVVGLPTPGQGTACQWSVWELAPVASVDAFTSPGPPAYLTNGSMTQSPQQSFTAGF